MGQRGLGLHRPHGTRPVLKNILSQTFDKIVCTFQIKFIFLLLYLLSFYLPSFRLSYVLAYFCRFLFPTYTFSYCVTNRKVAGSIPDVVIGIFRLHNSSVRTLTLWSTQSLTEMSTRKISWGKCCQCVRLTNVPSFCSVVMKSGNLKFLETSGPLQDCNGSALPINYSFSSENKKSFDSNSAFIYSIFKNSCFSFFVIFKYIISK